ncbi:MAG: sigma-54-dependent Fis family transcriptional regulator [Acidobacteria bacterium]|nr:sigma-54-dependent Fis family transcriptional regulator [Acidobacteriota bacterium]
MGEELLVVDDEPQMLIAINETLRRSGYSITTAGSGMEAIRRLKEKYYQLVITDMRMPEISGLDLLRKVKNLAPQTPVILLTAYGTIQNAVDAMRDGAYDYLLKPFSSDALEHIVRRALDSVPRKLEKVSHEIITQDPRFSRTLEQAGQAALSTATILIEAESGTGKELLARMIHMKSPRNAGPFVAVNCAALPENLLESELFGFEKGAFTGANVSKPGKFELASRGTLLLDEIGEMAPILQAKLLRVLQEKEIDRIGGKDPIDIDVRVIATTNRDLQALVKNEGFREDLYYRLNVVRLTIPPLRERSLDIPLLADLFCKRYAKSFGKQGIDISAEALEQLSRHDWPGNVRELENMIQRAVTLCAGSTIRPEDLHLSASHAIPAARPEQSKPAELGYSAGVTMREMERQLICRTLEDMQGNRTRAAKCLGISLRTLRNKLNEFGLQDRQNLPTLQLQSKEGNCAG